VLSDVLDFQQQAQIGPKRYLRDRAIEDSVDSAGGRPGEFALDHSLACRARAIEERALDIAIEQSVEMPVAAVRDASVLADIVGQVGAIEDRGDGWFDVEIGLAASTIGEMSTSSRSLTGES